MAIVHRPPSMDLYAPLVKPDGVLVLDSALIKQRSGREDIREIALHAKEIAAELGFPQAAHLVMLGALVEAAGVLRLETVGRSIEAHLGGRSKDEGARDANRRALRRRAECATAYGHVPLSIVEHHSDPALQTD